MPTKRIKDDPDGIYLIGGDDNSIGGIIGGVVSGITAPENRSMVTAVGLFAVCGFSQERQCRKCGGEKKAKFVMEAPF